MMRKGIVLKATFSQVEGDELTGVCLLGAQTDASLLHQLVIPHFFDMIES